MPLGGSDTYLDPPSGDDRAAISAVDAARTGGVPKSDEGTRTVVLARYKDVLTWAFITTGLTIAPAGPAGYVPAKNCTSVWLVNATTGAEVMGTDWCPAKGS